MRKVAWVCCGLAALTVLASCGALGPSASAVVDELQKQGRITVDEANAIKGGGSDWLPYLVTSVLSIAGALFGVNLQRGSPYARKGYAPPPSPSLSKK